MPPKGSKRAPLWLGNVQPHDAGWRVQATISGHHVYGPFRAQKAEAERDLVHARSVQTQEEPFSSSCTSQRGVAMRILLPSLSHQAATRKAAALHQCDQIAKLCTLLLSLMGRAST